MKKIFKNKSLNSSLVDQALVSGSNFISTLIIARLLGLYDFGVFASLWLILLFINSIHASTIVLPMMTLVSKQKNIKKYFSGLIINQIYFLVFSLFISFIISFYYLEFFTENNNNFYLSLLFSFTVMIYHAQDFYRRYFFSTKEFKNVLTIDILSYFLRVITLIYFLFFDNNISLNGVFLIIIIPFSIGTIIAILKSDFPIRYKRSISVFYQHLQLSKWLLPSGLMQWSSINFFLVLSSLLLGPISIGAIKIGQNIVMSFNVILQGLENFIPTDGSYIYHKNGLQDLKSYLKKITVKGLIVAIIFGVFISYFSADLIHILYSDIYLPYSYIIFWYSLIVVFMFLLIIVRVYIRIIEKTKIWFTAYFYTSVYSLIVSYPLTHFYKIHGVMFGILSAHIVLLVTTYYLLKREERK